MTEKIGVRMFAFLIFLVGGLNFFIGISFPGNQVFLAIGSICIVLSIGIFNLWNWARIAIIALSFAFILLVYVPLIVGTFLGYWQNFGGMGLIANFPALILSLLCINTFFRRGVKDLFTKNR